MKFSKHQQTPSRKAPSTSLANHQRGVALLVVLLLVVMIVVLAGSMLASKEMTTRKSRLIFEQDKLRQQIETGEQMAVELIRRDAEVNDSDSLQDVWVTNIAPYTTDDGYQIELVINDASARFNVNNLYHDGAVDEHALESFQRLLESLGLEPELAIVVLDWQDPDTLVYNDGSDEAKVYKANNQEITMSNQPSNQPFISIDQLENLPDINAETIGILRPYLTAVPYWLPINVNTADQLVLTAIVGSENSESVQNLLNNRVNTPIDSEEALQQLDLFSTSVEKPKDTNNNEPPANNDNAKNIEGSQGSTTKQSGREKKSAEQKETAVLSQSLSYQSKAFEVLISASIEQGSGSDSTKHSKKTRYETLLIAKGESLSNGDKNQGSLNNSLDDEQSIRAFSQRMWAFRPPFIEY